MRNIAIVVVLLAAIGFFYFRTVLSRPELDPKTLCPPDFSSLTILLVDVTDPMTLPQRQDFTNQFDSLITSIPRYGKLVVAKVDPVSDRLLEPVIARCNPGSAKDETEVSGNPQKREREYREKYEAPMKQVVERLLSASKANRSPILESIQSVNLTELQKSGLSMLRRKVVVASDLLQNTNTISFYDDLPEPNALTSSQAFSRVRTDLGGIDIELWMLQRGDSRLTQPRALPDLWDHIISKQGGRLVRVYIVSG